MWYFAYGSNVNAGRMKNRGVIPKKEQHAVLQGYVLTFNKQATANPKQGFANIQPGCGVVHGVVYSISEKDLETLDRYEGGPDNYERKTIKVMLDNGRIIEVVTFIANPRKVKPGLKPTKPYLMHFWAADDLLPRDYLINLNYIEILE